MEYGKILEQVEEQNKEKALSGKMFRYSGLIMAVDYFSQKLNSDQIMIAAFDFINELLTLDSSSLFCKKGDGFAIVREKGRSVGLQSIKISSSLNDLAVFHGNILTGKSSILKYFDEEIYHKSNIEIVVPIIVDTTLEGFLLIPEKTGGRFDEDDLIICQVLMNLCNSAMRNFESYNELQSINASLDEKIFNLFAINQSSKALLSQLDLDSLYGLSIDVFSELTQSSSTGFVLYDEKSEKYTLRSFRFIFESIKTLDIVLEIDERAAVDPNRIIIDLADENDVQYFNSLFNNGIKSLASLKAQYIILLNKGSHVLGFVTLGATVTGAVYKKNVFELIESLASSTYIAISNARHFRQVEVQKAIIQKKLDRLISLNALVRNINSSMDIESLIEITMKTLCISFFIEKCTLALFDNKEKQFDITCSHGVKDDFAVIKPDKSWSRILKGKTALALDNNELVKYFGQDFSETIGDITGALIVPIYMDRSEIELLGVMIVFSCFGSLISDEENVLTIETIAGHIAPILYNLNVIEEQRSLLVPNYSEIFKKALECEIKQAKELGLELYIIKVSHREGFSFNYPDIAGRLRSKYKKVYPMAYNTVYIIVNGKEDTNKENILELLLEPQNISVDTTALGRDFNSLEDFLRGQA